MRTRLFFFLAIIALGCAGLHKVNYDEIRKVPKQKLIPPGTVWLRDSTFIDKCEIRNLDYLEFLFMLSRQNTEEYRKMLPDTTCWKNIMPDSTALNYTLYYMRHPAYRNFPVVGIDYDQAIAFCKWRSLMVNRYLFIQANGGWKNFTPDSINILVPPEYVEYALPTKEEWEYASAAGLDYIKNPFGYESLLDEHNLPVSNTGELRNFSKQTRHISYKKNGRIISLDNERTQEVYYGKENCYNIYNLLGNVSEIIADRYYKGLSYHSTMDGNAFVRYPGDYIIIDSTINPYDYKYTFRYNKPQPWLGFRCICVVKKLPK